MTFDKHHPMVAKSLKNLEMRYRETGQEKKGEAFEKRAEAIWQLNINMKC
jgi:hypothetical protein